MHQFCLLNWPHIFFAFLQIVQFQKHDTLQPCTELSSLITSVLHCNNGSCQWCSNCGSHWGGYNFLCVWRKPNIAQYIVYCPQTSGRSVTAWACNLHRAHKQNATSKNAGGNWNIHKNSWDPDKIIIHRLTNCKQIVWIWSMLMTFTALLLCQERRLIFLLRRILRASSQGGDDLKSSSNCHQVTNVSQEALWWFYRLMKTMFLSLHFLLLLLLFTEWLPVILLLSVIMSAVKAAIYWQRSRDTDIIIQTPDVNCGFLCGLFLREKMVWVRMSPIEPGLGVVEKCQQGHHSPLQEAQTPTLAYLISTFKTISKPTVCV